MNEKREIIRYSYHGFHKFFTNLSAEFLKNKKFKNSMDKMFKDLTSSIFISQDEIHDLMVKDRNRNCDTRFCF